MQFEPIGPRWSIALAVETRLSDMRLSDDLIFSEYATRIAVGRGISLSGMPLKARETVIPPKLVAWVRHRERSSMVAAGLK